MRLKILLGGILLLFFKYSFSQCNEGLPVLPGAYQIEEYIPYLKGKTIAVVANNASRIENVHLVDSILYLNTSLIDKIDVQTIFSPEHGFSGKFDAGKIIEDEDQKMRSINIVSLYGQEKKPSDRDLKGIEAVLFDLQDVGVRFYTYISTMHYVMKACAENNIPVVVLDRPNPHCTYVDGPVLKEEYSSFVGMHPVPIVYGMTIGEYAQMINGEGWLGGELKCDLKVIKIKNYCRDSFYEYPFKPSPNLPNMKSIYLYPSLCLFEGTSISVGRGTEYPFQVYGHPKFVGKEFSFTPKAILGASMNPKYKDEVCYGVDLRRDIDLLAGYKSFKLSYLIESCHDFNCAGDYFNDYFDLLAGTDNLRTDILSGKTENEIKSSWSKDLVEFKEIRSKYLLYP